MSSFAYAKNIAQQLKNALRREPFIGIEQRKGEIAKVTIGDKPNPNWVPK